MQSHPHLHSCRCCWQAAAGSSIDSSDRSIGGSDNFGPRGWRQAELARRLPRALLGARHPPGRHVVRSGWSGMGGARAWRALLLAACAGCAVQPALQVGLPRRHHSPWLPVCGRRGLAHVLTGCALLKQLMKGKTYLICQSFCHVLTVVHRSQAYSVARLLSEFISSSRPRSFVSPIDLRWSCVSGIANRSSTVFAPAVSRYVVY